MCVGCTLAKVNMPRAQGQHGNIESEPTLLRAGRVHIHEEETKKIKEVKWESKSWFFCFFFLKAFVLKLFGLKWKVGEDRNGSAPNFHGPVQFFFFLPLKTDLIESIK